MSNEKIVKRSIDFSRWYTSIIKESDLIDYSLIKGMVVLKPYAWSIWKLIEKNIDIEFSKLGIQNCSLPMLIPISEFEKEKDHVEGFAPEFFTITKVGNSKLEVPYVLRPTSEILFCNYFKNNIMSHNDMPIMLNQWCNVFRAEKNTRPFLRTSEFFWQEQHSVFSNAKDAKQFAFKILNLYKDFFENKLCIPVLSGFKTENEKFSGAEFTLTIESIMQDGQALQSGTSHYLGQNFSKAYDMKFQNSENKFSYMEQTSAGISTRVIGAIIMSHSDDNGLVLPSAIAPYEVKINTLFGDRDNRVLEAANKLFFLLSNKYRVLLDNSDKSIGFKMIDGEIKGYPLQISIGPKDLDNNLIEIYNRYNQEKNKYSIDSIDEKFIDNLLKQYNNNLYNRAKSNLESKIVNVNTYNELKDVIDNKKVAFCYFAGDAKEESKIKEETGSTTRCIVEQEQEGECIITKKKTKNKVYFARAY